MLSWDTSIPSPQPAIISALVLSGTLSRAAAVASAYSLPVSSGKRRMRAGMIFRFHLCHRPAKAIRRPVKSAPTGAKCAAGACRSR